LRGLTPWTFAIHHSGRWMLVANEASSTVNLFSIDRHYGTLTDTGASTRSRPRLHHALLAPALRPSPRNEVARQTRRTAAVASPSGRQGTEGASARLAAAPDRRGSAVR